MHSACVCGVGGLREGTLLRMGVWGCGEVPGGGAGGVCGLVTR